MHLRGISGLLLLTTACTSAIGASTDASSADASTSDSAGVNATLDGGADTPLDGGAIAQDKLVCDALQSRAQCDGGTASACNEADRCVYRLLDPIAAQAYATCHGAPSCKGNNECRELAAKQVAGQAATDYVAECTAKLTTCGTGTFSDDFCGAGAFAYPGIGPAARACLLKACNEVSACLQGVAKPISDCKN
jgi:hypothetical protein